MAAVAEPVHPFGPLMHATMELKQSAPVEKDRAEPWGRSSGQTKAFCDAAARPVEQA